MTTQKYPPSATRLDRTRQVDLVSFRLILIVWAVVACSRLSAADRPLDAFHFKGIPEHVAGPNRPLEFMVTTHDPFDPENPGPNAPLKLFVDPQPGGSIQFDSASGTFRYVSVPSDWLPFSITFTAPNGAEGSTVITPRRADDLAHRAPVVRHGPKDPVCASIPQPRRLDPHLILSRFALR